MKKYTQEEFDALERNSSDAKVCPTGDYSEIVTFGERCSFGEWCSFGERCSFGQNATCENGREFVRLFAVEGPGRERRKTYFWLLADGSVYVRCGCFAGTAEDFLKKVNETHGDSKHARVYKMCMDLAMLEFKG